MLVFKGCWLRLGVCPVNVSIARRFVCPLFQQQQILLPGIFIDDKNHFKIC